MLLLSGELDEGLGKVRVPMCTKSMILEYKCTKV